MNNRHLYKAKRMDNGEWVEGYLYRISEQLNPFIMLKNRHAESHEVDPSTICQCTGLTDKNDKLIWENDIVTTSQYGIDDGKGHNYAGFDKFLIKFCDASFILENKLRIFYLRPVRGFEVIGNIFDNPELLEVGE